MNSRTGMALNFQATMLFCSLSAQLPYASTGRSSVRAAAVLKGSNTGTLCSREDRTPGVHTARGPGWSAIDSVRTMFRTMLYRISVVSPFTLPSIMS